MMTIPFLDFFKKKTVKGQPITTVGGGSPAVEKPSGERLSKTVVPNATRTPRATDPFQSQNPAPAPAPGRAFSLGGNTGSNRTSDLPPAVALAIEPKVERVITLDLADVANQIPAGWVRPVSEAEAGRRVLLKAAEIEKGMSSGRPSVSVASIFKQVPEIFVRPVPDSDTTQVQLPFTKVLEQFKNLQRRPDQQRDRTVPQVETPFLKVTLEDNTKFGIEMGPVEIASELPPARIELATAESLAAAHPEAALGIKMPEPISATAKTNGIKPVVIAPPPMAAPVIPPPAPAPIAAATPPPPAPAPTRIPFKLSPTGPDAPATERVPASGGPSAPSDTVKAAPTRIPFKMTPPSEAAPAKSEPWLTKENFDNGAAASAPEAAPVAKAEPAAPPQKAGEKISLLLKPILQTLPPFQLTGDIGAVPDDTRFEVPFALVEAQLASGRISLKPEEFAAALPEKYRSLFSTKEISAPVALLLPDVLKNLPSTSLRIRSDQEEGEKGADFATPFSAKAAEDAQRFNAKAGVAPKPLRGPATPQVKREAEPVAAKPAAEKPPTVSAPVEAAPKPASRSELQSIFDTDEEIDAKAVVAHVGKIAGIKGCAIMFSDGLSLAGNLPEEFAADGLCAMAPSFLQKIESHLCETKLGELGAMTLSCAGAAVTFFTHDNLCLTALHAKADLAAEVRDQLARAVHELSKKYSHPVQEA